MDMVKVYRESEFSIEIAATDLSDDDGSMFAVGDNWCHYTVHPDEYPYLTLLIDRMVECTAERYGIQLDRGDTQAYRITTIRQPGDAPPLDKNTPAYDIFDTPPEHIVTVDGDWIYASEHSVISDVTFGPDPTSEVAAGVSCTVTDCPIVNRADEACPHPDATNNPDTVRVSSIATNIDGFSIVFAKLLSFLYSIGVARQQDAPTNIADLIDPPLQEQFSENTTSFDRLSTLARTVLGQQSNAELLRWFLAAAIEPQSVDDLAEATDMPADEIRVLFAIYEGAGMVESMRRSGKLWYKPSAGYLDELELHGDEADPTSVVAALRESAYPSVLIGKAYRLATHHSPHQRRIGFITAD